MTTGAPRKSGWGEVGHKWITAIAALITALTGAGFFIGRASAPDSKPAAAGTVTVTTGATHDEPGGQNTPASTPPVNADPAVYLAKDLDWGEYNLDFREPRPVSGRSVQRLDNILYVSGGETKIVEWKSDSVPAKEQCGAFVVEQGSNQTGRLTAASRVCGRTDEGRVFRIDFHGVGDNGFRTTVTVWNK